MKILKIRYNFPVLTDDEVGSTKFIALKHKILNGFNAKIWT